MASVLGLDLGPNSIGWAIVNDTDNNIIASGVRIFPEGLENFDTAKEKSLNEQRRTARGMRRQIKRRAHRKECLRQALIDAGLWPDDIDSQNKLLQTDPYALRARALEEKITLHELGRVLLHLNQRRGFRSNRKIDKPDTELKGMKAEMSELQADIEATDARTLGEYLYLKTKSLSHANRVENDHVRNRHTRRDMLEEEFQTIWKLQQRFHPETLTDQLAYGKLTTLAYPSKPIPKHHSSRKGLSDLEAFGLYGLIFFQRPMYWPKSVVGLCELEPKQRRCPRGHRLAQKFRLLQEVNNLRYTDPVDHTECPLSDGYRAMLMESLSTRKEMTFDQIRKKLGFDESVRFNLENAKRTKLKGLSTDWSIANAVGKQWHQRDEEQKTRIVELLLDADIGEDETLDTLIEEYGFTAEQADKLLNLDFGAKYANLSTKALRKLLPHMERGLRYMGNDEADSALHAAGYLRPDQLQRRIFDTLPDPARIAESPIGEIPNPVVRRALGELRRVVNTIIREHGKPDAIHVEMARSMQLGKDRRGEINKKNAERRDAREEAAQDIRAGGIRPTRDAIERYILYKQQNQECIYCGKAISQSQLFTGEIDVDHILPQSKWPDNSQTNKVVCHRSCNHSKSRQTPYEWMQSNPEAYDRFCLQARSLLQKNLISYTKYRRLLQKHVDADKFDARQLVDTGYIARATVEYLHCLFEHKHAVLGLKGQYTSEMRHQWGLEPIISELPASPAWEEQNKLRPGEKNRADHRHHALDAIILAMTNRSRIYQLGKAFQSRYVIQDTGELVSPEHLPEPWDNFRESVRAALAKINISHKVQRKVSGPLHEDTFYGPVKEAKNNHTFVLRKPLTSLSPNEITKIRDKAIRQIIINHLTQAGLEVGRAKKPDGPKLKAALSDIRMPSGVPIRKVRLLKDDKTIMAIRKGKSHQALVRPGNTHHLCIFEWSANGKTKRDAVFVTMLEAARRIKNKETLIQRTPPKRHPTIPPDARFVMSLSAGEQVLANVKGREQLLVFKTSASTQGQLYFVTNTDARSASKQRKIVFNANTLNARKVTVDLMGRIRWAND